MRYSDCFGRKSSRIILGTAYFGDGIDKDNAFLMMDKFREMGGTHIDTDGKAEKIVGESALSEKARKRYLCQENINRTVRPFYFRL